MVVGVSNEVLNGTIHAGSMATWLKDTEPLPVTRWPNPSQSSTMSTPGAVRGTKTSRLVSTPLVLLTASVGIQCENKAPVQ